MRKYVCVRVMTQASLIMDPVQQEYGGAGIETTSCFESVIYTLHCTVVFEQHDLLRTLCSCFETSDPLNEASSNAAQRAIS
jgi:hypothetical protein